MKDIHNVNVKMLKGEIEENTGRLKGLLRFCSAELIL